MNSKKLLITIGAIVVVLVIGAFLWRGVKTAPVSPSSTEGITPVTQPGVEGQAGGQGEGQTITSGQTAVGGIGKMTDEIYIEILAQSGYYAQKHPTDSMGAISHTKDLYKKYGITAENLSAYGEELEKDPLHQGEIGARLAQRLQELQKTGE